MTSASPPLQAVSTPSPAMPPPRASLRPALLLFLTVRLLLSIWGALIVRLVPAALQPDTLVRPYLGAPALLEGFTGLLLGPWQRFDTLRYLMIAREGYSVQNSVFPPLFPLLARAGGAVVGAISNLGTDAANLLAAIIIGNIALLAALALLHHITWGELDKGSAGRAILYLLVFPTGFFLFAAYTEALFLFFALVAVWAARRDRPVLAGLAGLLAALTRLTGWVLVVPLAYAYLRHRSFSWRRIDWQAAGPFLPLVGLLLFVVWRSMAGLPPLAGVYRDYWLQTTGLPGYDLLRAVVTLFTGTGSRAGEYSLLFDLLSFLLLVGTTAWAWRRLPRVYVLYSVMMLFFMLLPTSLEKPLFSFGRYTLVFFPTFMVLGQAGKHPWRHRLILYPSLLLYLFFSGQFFLWGWVG